MDKLLDNEKYVGDVILMKTYTPEVGAKRKKNRGKAVQYTMTDGHPPIISREAFAAVQEQKKLRSNVEMVDNEVKRTGKRYISTFSLPNYINKIREEIGLILPFHNRALPCPQTPNGSLGKSFIASINRIMTKVRRHSGRL